MILILPLAQYNLYTRINLIPSSPCPPTQPAPSVSPPNVTHFGSLMSSIRATNSAKRIRLLLRIIAFMLSLPVLMSASR